MSFENIYTFEGEKVPEEKFPFVDHLVFKIFDVKKEIILSKRKLVNILESICKIHKLKVVDRKLTEFKGGGMTVSFILANSNLTVHTWPEYGSVHIDLVSCSPIFNKSELYLTLKKYFETDKIDVFFVE
jgi:S-adenosylmethionine decarboxylase